MAVPELGRAGERASACCVLCLYCPGLWGDGEWDARAALLVGATLLVGVVVRGLFFGGFAGMAGWRWEDGLWMMVRVYGLRRCEALLG
jgi:hypothetical protein